MEQHREVVWYCPASVASNNHCSGLVCPDLAFMGLVISFRPVSGNSLAQSFLDLSS